MLSSAGPCAAGGDLLPNVRGSRFLRHFLSGDRVPRAHHDAEQNRGRHPAETAAAVLPMRRRRARTARGERSACRAPALRCAYSDGDAAAPPCPATAPATKQACTQPQACLTWIHVRILRAYEPGIRALENVASRANSCTWGSMQLQAQSVTVHTVTAKTGRLVRQLRHLLLLHAWELGRRELQLDRRYVHVERGARGEHDVGLSVTWRAWRPACRGRQSPTSNAVELLDRVA